MICFVVLLAVLALVTGEANLQVSTTKGEVLGHMEGNVRVWKGIPYAQPPVGDLRWQYPKAPAPFTAVYEANFEADGCAQKCVLPPGNCPAEDKISEDCLYMTIMAPEEPSPDAAGYPVLFWIHGGAYTQGQGNSPLYNGTNFANNGVINVVINYRLGAMGFLAGEGMTGNYGLMDQRMALEYVRDNIAVFGGDPKQVTIAGQSAGAMSVGSHLISPYSKGLYSRAIMESNCLGMPYHTRASAKTNYDAMVDYLKCDDGKQACMKDKTWQEIVEAQGSAIKMDRKTLFINFLPFAPLVDPEDEDAFLKQQPLDALSQGNLNPVPILSGSLYDEGVLFVDELFPDKMSKTKYHLTVDAIFGTHKAKTIKKKYPLEHKEDGRDAFAKLATDLIFYCPLRNVTRGMQQTLGTTTVPTWQYRFKHVLSFDCWGPTYSFCNGKVCHGSELPFVWNVFSGTGFSYNPTADENKLAIDMNDAWSNFVSGGAPNDGRAVAETFELYNPESSPLVILDEPDYSNENDPRAEYCDMWDSMGYFY